MTTHYANIVSHQAIKLNNFDVPAFQMLLNYDWLLSMQMLIYQLLEIILENKTYKIGNIYGALTSVIRMGKRVLGWSIISNYENHL